MKLSPVVQMCHNAQCWLADTGFAPLDILESPAPQSDRCYLSSTWDAVANAETLMDEWDLGIKAKAHQPLSYPSAIDGWREQKAWWGCQIIRHRRRDNTEFLELDFDGCNPGYGLFPIIGHGIECLVNSVWKTKTDPARVAKARGWDAEV